MHNLGARFQSSSQVEWEVELLPLSAQTDWPFPSRRQTGSSLRDSGWNYQVDIPEPRQ